MRQKSWVVYKHTSPSGKVYIGITSNIRHRWRAEGKGYIGSTRIWYAIQKYGFDSFRHDILYTDLSKEQAEEHEIALIAQYNSTDVRFGYNLQQGGKVRLMTEESRQKLSDSLKGHPVNIEQIKYLARMKSKEVVCIETGIAYESIQSAADACGILRSSISKVLRVENGTAGGYHWVFKGSEVDFILQKRTYYNNKKVLCVTTGVVYDSVSEAGKLNNINRKSIANACNGISKTADRCYWKYID